MKFKLVEGARQNLWDTLVRTAEYDLANNYSNRYPNVSKNSSKSIEEIIDDLNWSDKKLADCYYSRNLKGKHLNTYGKYIPNDRPWTTLLDIIEYELSKEK